MNNARLISFFVRGPPNRRYSSICFESDFCLRSLLMNSGRCIPPFLGSLPPFFASISFLESSTLSRSLED